jgi:hypothetical protein
MSARDDDEGTMSRHQNAAASGAHPDDARHGDAAEAHATHDVVAELLDDARGRSIGPRAEDAELAAVLSAVRQLGSGPAPAPSAALAAAFAGVATDELAVRRLRRRHRAALAALVIGMTSIGATGVAAANDTLPPGPQKVVSRMVDDLTPFRIDPAPSVAPSPSPRSPASSTAVPHPAPVVPGDQGEPSNLIDAPSPGATGGSNEPDPETSGGEQSTEPTSQPSEPSRGSTTEPSHESSSEPSGGQDSSPSPTSPSPTGSPSHEHE